MFANNKKYWFVSLVLVCVGTAIPPLGMRVDEYSPSYFHFGFPADWFHFYGGSKVDFEILGFLFNLVFFYVIIRLVSKIFK
ncbi:hypothetical protein BSG1_04950 [Bacillus sp. SG-1]|nr:hypothetical protein BSG1_04950 [Bacillus sp. SG-1]